MIMKKFSVIVLALLPLTFFACGDDEVEPLTASDISISYQQELIVPDNLYSGMVIENNFIASYSNGIVKGNHVGKTTAQLKKRGSINIQVKSTINSIKEISREWGTAKSLLINNSELGDFVKSSTSGADVYGAKSSNNKVVYMYSFTNNVLSSSSLVVHKDYINELATYLKERFTLIDGNYLTGSGIRLAAGGYDSNDVETATTIMAVTVYNENFYLVSFMPNK